MNDDVEVPAGEMTVYTPPPASGQVVEYRPQLAMAPKEAATMDHQLRQMMRAILKEGVDFGVIPGTQKPSLWKPGAEKLLQWFGLGHVNEPAGIERDADGKRLGVTYRCTVTKSLPDGRVIVVATCEGYAGYDEDRFFVTTEDAQAKAKAKEMKFAAKDGRQPKSAKWEYETGFTAPWNSVVKMAQKRALVGAALAATSASTLFTQDVEDIPGMDGDGVAAVSAIAMDLINELPGPVKAALDRWYRGKRWGDPQTWDTARWCQALVAAGQFDEQEKARASAAPAADPAPAGDAPADSDGVEWLAWALAEVSKLTTLAACTALYKEGGARQKAGKITQAEATHLAGLITARSQELRDGRSADTEAQFVTAWEAKLGQARSPEAVDALREDLAAAVKAKKVSEATAADLNVQANMQEQAIIDAATGQEAQAS